VKLRYYYFNNLNLNLSDFKWPCEGICLNVMRLCYDFSNILFHFFMMKISILFIHLTQSN
jgi:hypothetical protein